MRRTGRAARHRPVGAARSTRSSTGTGGDAADLSHEVITWCDYSLRVITSSDGAETGECFLGLTGDSLHELGDRREVVDDADDLAARHDAGAGVALDHGATQEDRRVP